MFDTVMIGKRVAQLRKEKNMTQMELADRMGVSYQAVSNWERGNSMPDISRLSEICGILELSMDELLGDERTGELASQIAENDGELPREETVTPEEFTQLAPILKPDQTKRVFEQVEENFTVKQLIAAAPFLEEDLLNELALRAAAHGCGDELAGLAPFLSEETVGKIVTEYYDGGNFMAFLPFMGENALAALAQKIFAEKGMEGLLPMLPFLNSDALGTMFRNKFGGK